MKGVAQRIDGTVRVRPEAARCRIALRGLTSQDSHTIDLLFSCSVLALDQEAERAVLAETFLGDRESVGVEEIAAHFAPALRQAVDDTIESQSAGHWLGESSKAPLIEALRAAAKPVAFSCGVELMPPFELSVESPTLQRQKIEAVQRKLFEDRAADQAGHLARAAELLRQFQSLRDAAPNLSPGKLLEQVSPADRGSMLETLLLASASHAVATLWAVAGPNLLRIDPRQSPPRCELFPLPADLGPLRSVQGEGSSLLIGAQSGVMAIEPDRPGDATCYADREVTSSLGFNSVVRIGDMILATHGEAGIVAWRVEQPDQPAWTIRARGQGPRNAVAVNDSRVLCSAGPEVLVVNRDGVPATVDSGDANVVLVAVESDGVLIVRADGTVDRLDRGTLQRVRSTRAAGDVTAAATLPWLGATRLLLATADGPVLCVGLDDPLVTQYQGPHRGLRVLSATSDLIAGVSPDRQRIVLWNSWETRKSCAEIYVAAIARHRVADVCFI